jgi:predicted MarR family transcription regulator
MTPGAMTYYLRRLRCHGLIVRTAHTHRYKLTLTGLRAALVLSRCHDRLLWPAMAAITPGAARTSPIGRALDTITAEIDRRQAHLATAA